MLDVGGLPYPNRKGVIMNEFVSAVLRRASPAVFAGLVAATMSPAFARADDPAPVPPAAKAAANATAAPAASATGEKWRFVWHNDQWWYYQPNGTWMIHDGNAWHPQGAVAPAAQAYQPAQNYNRRSYQPQYRQFMGSGRNGGGMSNDGFWGNSPRYWTYQHVF